MESIKLLGSGIYTPELVITNDDFAKFLDTSDEWISTRTGMKERHLSQNEPAWLMGTNAAKNAISNSGLEPNDIDMVIVTSVTPDYNTPSTACIISGELGISDTMALDINVACTGFAFGLDMARRYLQTGDVHNVLFINTELLSQITDYTDRSSCVLFGDGASAYVITKGEGLYGSYQSSDPSGGKHLYAKRARRKTPFGDYSNEIEPFESTGTNTLAMNGKEVYKFSTKAMPMSVEKACEKAGIVPTDLDLIIPHQANIRIIETAIKNLGLSADKFFVNIEKYGNTSSASIGIALHEAITSGRVKSGDKVCVVGFGGGLTFGATIFEF